MARFVIKNPEIKVVPAGKQNAGNEYLRVQLVMINDPFAPAITVVFYEKHVVDALRDYIPVNKGGKSMEDKPLPPQYAEVYGGFFEFAPPQKFHKTYLTAHPATPTRPAINVGDKVSRNGVPVIYDKLIVFCRQYMDDDGTLKFCQNSDPMTVGMEHFMSYCVPVTENTDDPTLQPIPF